MWMRFISHFEAGTQGNIYIMSELEKFDPCYPYLTHNHDQLSEVSGWYHVIIRQCLHLPLPYYRPHIDGFWGHKVFTDLVFSLPFPYVVYIYNCPTWYVGCMNMFLSLLFLLSQLQRDFGAVQASTIYSLYSGCLVVLKQDPNPPQSCTRYTTLNEPKIKAKHRLEVEICEVTIFDHLLNRASSTAYNAKKSL